MGLAAEAGTRGDPLFGAVPVDPSGTVVARAANRQASEILGGVLATEAAEQIASFRAERPPID